VVGYAWSYGTRLWVTVVGNEQFLDSFADLEVYGNSVYVLTNSFSTKYATNSSQTDIYYYRLRSENGYVEFSEIFGSPSMDTALDLVVTFNGPILLALVGNPFLPHRDGDKQWRTQNTKENIVIILFDFNDRILEIEGYDNTLSTAVKPYPTKILVTRNPNTQALQYAFASHRSNAIVDKRGGVFFTYL
jgi:hypothetical protein